MCYLNATFVRTRKRIPNSNKQSPSEAKKASGGHNTSRPAIHPKFVSAPHLSDLCFRDSSWATSVAIANCWAISRSSSPSSSSSLSSSASSSASRRGVLEAKCSLPGGYNPQAVAARIELRGQRPKPNTSSHNTSRLILLPPRGSGSSSFTSSLDPTRQQSARQSAFNRATRTTTGRSLMAANDRHAL